YSQIEDEELAQELVESYAYPSEHDHSSNNQDVRSDVLFFAEQLYEIDYLTIDPEEFTDKAYAEVDLTLGQ
ncbi:MAG: hypothetical protein ACRDBM_13470, partial [Sporomusa sp.]